MTEQSAAPAPTPAPAETAPPKRNKTGRIILAVVMLLVIGSVVFLCSTETGIDLIAKAMMGIQKAFPGGSAEKEMAAAKTIEDLDLLVIKEREGEGQKVTSISRKGPKINRKVFEVLPDLYRIGTVNLTNTDIGDEQLKSIGKLSRLTSLLIGGTAVTNDGLVELRNLGELESLQMPNTAISDAGLANVASLPKLKILDLSGTKITDEGMKELAKCQSLNWLLVANTSLTDKGLESLENLPDLGRLTINKTKTTQAGVDKLVKAMSAKDKKLSVDFGDAPVPDPVKDLAPDTSTEDPLPEEPKTTDK